MIRSRGMVVGLCGLTVACAVALGCVDRVAEPSRPTRAATASRSPGVSDEQRDEAKRDFHARNRADWVGVAHNRAIDDYRARLRRGDVTHDMCNDLVAFMSDEGRMPGHAERGAEGRAQRTALVRGALRKTVFCAGDVAAGARSDLLSLTQATAVSPATQVLLDQVQAATASATGSGDLAIALNPIVLAGAALPNGEGELVSATASVAQSSMEYWEENLDAVKLDYDRAYGACAVGTTSVENLALKCLGMTARGVLPTLHRGGGSTIMHLTQGADLGHCNAMNGHDILGDDVKGAVAGAISGFFTSGVGALPGAAIGAGGASLGSAAWQWAQTTYCVLGGGGKQPRQKAT